MNNNKNTLRILLALAIIIAFFLPWFKYSGGSGLDIVMAKGAYENTTAAQIIRYSFLLIPLFAVLVLIRAINKQSAGFGIRLLPFLVTALLTTLFILGIKEQGGDNEVLRSWLQLLGYGFYINTIASFLLILI